MDLLLRASVIVQENYNTCLNPWGTVLEKLITRSAS